ncbi:hypothetical protein CVT24_004762 [Panaeolus cyanescens]|uniref:Uncharacterized protein n=1 Tax=Panaeolus cyanescens TaxID=181874 RepID=A0A409V9T5_9AGAR|nr:hypothetical protein CVT24_004762 [Panaeolus cyanescens]
MSMDNEYDHVPGDIADLDVNWEATLGPSERSEPSNVLQQPVSPGARSTASSYEVEEMDDIMIAAFDRADQEINATSSSDNSGRSVEGPTAPPNIDGDFASAQFIILPFRVVNHAAMQITFNPPLGQRTRITNISASTSHATVTLTFTAQVGAEEYAAISNNGGRVQVWTDIPLNGTYDGSWREAEFNLQDATTHISSSMYEVSMDGWEADGDVTHLHAVIGIVVDTLINRVFQFTYRIKYDSGQVDWFGDSRSNGSVVLETMGRFDGGIALFDGWANLDNDSWLFRSESECLEQTVAKVDRSQYRIWSLGEESLLAEPKAASILFLVPRHHKPLVPTPTYIFSASRGLVITLVVDDVIAVTGAGSLAIQTAGQTSDAEKRLKELFSRTGLDNWRIFASDPKTHTVAIASNVGQDLVKALVIPLWSSPWTRHSVSIPYSEITGIFTKNLNQDVVVFSPYKLQVWVFKQGCNVESVSLAYVPTGNAFVITLVHHLTGADSKQSARGWMAAIFSKHRILSSPTSATLPTPSASPKSTCHVEPAKGPTPSTSLSAQSIVTQSNASESFAASRKNISTSQGVLGLFKSIFTSLGIFLRVFCRLFCGRTQSLATSRPRPPPFPSPISPTNERTSISCETGSTTSSYGTIAHIRQGGLHAQVAAPDDEKLFGELQYDVGDLHLNTTTATVAIISVSQDADHREMHDKCIERSVVFLDGSNLQCAVSKCSVVFVDGLPGRKPNILEGSCSLLEYQLNWENSQSGRGIQIQSPRYEKSQIQRSL